MYIKIKYNFLKILSCAFFRNGVYIACGSHKGTIIVWNLNEINKICYFLKLHDFPINHMLLCSKSLYTISLNGNCKIIDIETCKNTRTFTNLKCNPIGVDIHEEILMTINRENIIKFWDKRVKFQIESIFCSFSIHTAKFSPESSKIIVANSSSEIFLWDLRKIKKEKIENYRLNQKKFQIHSFSITYDRSAFFLSSRNDFFQSFLDISRNSIKYRKIEKIFSFGKNIYKNSKKTSCDKRGIFFGCGTRDSMVFIWSQEKGKIIYKIDERVGSTRCFDFHPIDNIYCICGKNNILVIKKFSNLSFF